MENILVPLILVAIGCIVFGLVLAIVKKIRKRPAKKSMILVGVSFVMFVVATIALPEPSVEQQIGGLALSGTYISTNKDRELVFDGKTATLYENGEQIQTGTYEYRGERSINIHYEDYGELLIYTVDTKEILYQGNGNAINLGEVEYVKEGVANPDLTALDIEYPPSSIHYTGDEDQAAVPSNDTKDDISNDKLEESEQSMGHSDDAEYIGADLWLNETTDFSEGRAWVQFSESDRKKGSLNAMSDTIDAATGDKDDLIKYGIQNYNPQGNHRAALIDTQGKILWESALTKNDQVLSEISEFADGLAYFVFNGNDKSNYNIIDSNGNVTFTRDCGEDYIILGHGNGLFLVAEHTVNFDSNEWKIGAIDKSGNIVAPLKTYEEIVSFDSSEYSSCEYLGENIYKLDFHGWYVLLNSKTQSIIYTYKSGNSGSIRDFIADFENGAATVLYEQGMDTSICSLGTDGTITTIVDNDWTKYALPGNADNTLHDGLIYLYSESGYQGSEAFPVGAYYNLEGKKVIDFPQYRGKNLYHCDPFYSGYAAMSLKGADGLFYITAINKNGELMFDPISGFSAVYTSEDGKYVTAAKRGSITVFDITGVSLVSVNYARIAPDQEYEDFEYNVYDGVIKIEDIYVNVEDGTVIGLHGDRDADFSVTLHQN